MTVITFARRFRRRAGQAGRHQAAQPLIGRVATLSAPVPDDGKSVTDILRELDEREAAENAALPGVPTFTPAPAAETGPLRAVGAAPYIPVYGDPLSQGTPVFPAEQPKIGDSLDPRPAWAQAPVREAPGTAVTLYCGRRWPAKIAALRQRDGQFEDLHRLIADGKGRNLAECLTAWRHSREQMPQRALELCASLGWPDLVSELLRRVEQYNAQAAQAREARTA